MFGHFDFSSLRVTRTGIYIDERARLNVPHLYACTVVPCMTHNLQCSRRDLKLLARRRYLYGVRTGSRKL